jgi:acetyl-CoA acetyltransferase
MRADAEHLSASRDITRTAARLTGDAVMRSAGLEPSDIDVFFAYDSFTIAVITQVEDHGFCAKGEGGAFVAGDALTLTGRLPTNTHGGLLSHGHPGRPGGIAHITEAVRQLRGIAVNQVDGAETALIHGAGGPMTTHATVALAVA